MTISSEPTRREATMRAAELFFTRKYEDLVHAAGLLGGAGAQRRCLRLSARLRRADRMNSHCRRELRWLHDLLFLQSVDDPEAIDAAHYCEVAPDDPRVHDLCLLAEAFGDLLAEIDSVQTQAVSEKADTAGRNAA